VTSFANDAMAHLVLGSFREAEMRRLDEKVLLMRAGRFGERERDSDAAWALRNARMLDTVDCLVALSPPPY
jgi:hypothetical protein